MNHIPFPTILSITIKDRTRFWAKIQRTESCWLWTGSKILAPEHRDSYGNFKLQRESYYSHRVSYFFEYRIDPSSLMVLHDCNNSLCVNPQHLFLGTGSENQQHRADSGKVPIGSLAPNSSLTEEDIPIIIRRNGEGESGAKIALSYNLNRSTINAILRGEKWKHVPR